MAPVGHRDGKLCFTGGAGTTSGRACAEPQAAEGQRGAGTIQAVGEVSGKSSEDMKPGGLDRGLGCEGEDWAGREKDGLGREITTAVPQRSKARPRQTNLPKFLIRKNMK